MTKWLIGGTLAVLVLSAILLLKFSGPWPKVVINQSKKSYTRVVALAPSLTETMIALNQTHRLVGVTIHCQDPQLNGVARVGSFAEPNFEAIMAERPDLVLGVPHVMAKKVLNKLRESGVEVFAHQPDTLDDIKLVNRRLAEKFEVVKRGQAINQEIDRAIIKARAALLQGSVNNGSRTMLIAISHVPFVVAGRTTFASEILEHIGLTNLASSKTPWPVWPLEKLLTDPPGYLILAGGIETLPSFQSIFNSLGLDLNKTSITLIVPHRPIFESPSPSIIKDTAYLTDLFLADV